MPSIYDLQPGQRISFEVYPSAIIGTHFREVYLDGVITPHVAQATGFDIEAYHAKVYPTLPPGTAPDDPRGYNYIRIRHANGGAETVGIPWIRQDTIQVLHGGRVTLTFEDRTQADVERIVKVLSANNLTPSHIHVEQVVV